MKWKVINIIFGIIILLEFGIIKSKPDIKVEESVPTLSRVEETSLNYIIKSLNTNNEVEILNMIHNKDNYSVNVQIKGNKKEFTRRLVNLKDCNIIGYELKIKNEEVIGLIMLKYPAYS